MNFVKKHYILTVFIMVVFVLLQTCGDNRGPLSTEEANQFNLTLTTETNVGKAQIDTIELTYSLTGDGNVISTRTREVQFKSKYGIIDTSREAVQEGNAKPLRAKYVYPRPVQDTVYDTVMAFYVVPYSQDTVSDFTVVRIDPLLEGSGYLTPAILNLEVRTDTVYKVGAGWKMFVYAKVSDSLGNPVRNGIPVNFSFDSTLVDTNLVSLVNVSQTGKKQCIGEVCDSLPGQAISLLTYASPGISDMVVLSATLDGKAAISNSDTLTLPLPKEGLRLQAHYRNAGDLIVNFGPDTARIEVTLQDAYHYPVPNKTVCVTPRGGLGVPSCYVRNEAGQIVGSAPCKCSADPALCDTLPEPYCGLTDNQGSFMYQIEVKPSFQLDPAVLKQTVRVELEEQETHIKNLEFNFDVLFPL